jgi:hypothetical protein
MSIGGNHAGFARDSVAFADTPQVRPGRLTQRRRWVATTFCILAVLIAVSQRGLAQGAITYYVATNGNNAWSGTRDTPSGNDGPFLTLQRAQNAVRTTTYPPAVQLSSGATAFAITSGKRGTIEFVTHSGGPIGVLGIRIPPTLTFTTLPALAK